MSAKLIIPSKPQIAIVYRGATPVAVNLAKTLSRWLAERGYKVFTAPEQKKIQGTNLITKPALGQMGLIIVLGGDGTYLRAVRLLEGRKVPILGVNLGSLGFLTTTKAEEVLTAVEFTLQNKMTLVPRSMIEIQLKGKKELSMLALNDVVIERGTLSQLINIEIHYDKELISDVKADGIIISSPTGSTAYNLSAGGPILHPEVQAFVITPIAPHSLASRPLIMSDKGNLTFQLVGKMQKGHLVVDGQKVADLTSGDRILIRKGKSDHLMVLDPNFSYFHLLREKLKFGDRA